jgi:hypothetical protein
MWCAHDHGDFSSILKSPNSTNGRSSGTTAYTTTLQTITDSHTHTHRHTPNPLPFKIPASQHPQPAHVRRKLACFFLESMIPTFYSFLLTTTNSYTHSAAISARTRHAIRAYTIQHAGTGTFITLFITLFFYFTAFGRKGKAFAMHTTTNPIAPALHHHQFLLFSKGREEFYRR